MLLTEIHKMSVENGKEALAVYYHSKRRGKFRHLMLYEFIDQLGPIFVEFMHNKNVDEGRKTLKLKMELFCKKE